MRFMRLTGANVVNLRSIIVASIAALTVSLGLVLPSLFAQSHDRPADQSALLVVPPNPTHRAEHTWFPPRISQFIATDQVGRNVYSGDLVVEAGETIPGDAIVYDGDVVLHTDSRVAGDLVVYSGNIDIGSGASVDGDVAAFSGNVSVAGAIGGDVAAWSGDVTVTSSGYVAGDIAVLSGEVDRQEGAVIDGDIVRGPSFRFPLAPGRPFLFDIGPDLPGTAGLSYTEPTIWERTGRLLVRLVGAGLLAVLLALLAGALVFVRPGLVDSTYAVIKEQTALSFVVGLLSNLVLLILGMLLTITLCLIPVALIPFLLVFAINLVGITAIFRRLGQRLSRYFGYTAEPAVYAGVGMLVFVGLVGALFALGSCFQVIGMVVLLVVGSLGSGGVLLPWLRKYGTESVDTAEPAPIRTTEEADGAPEATAALDEQPTSSEEDCETEEYPAADEEESDAPSPPETVPVDDFLQIRGIGPVSEQRLRAANITTFQELASMAPAQLGEVLGWSVERVERGNIIGQAQDLAGK